MFLSAGPQVVSMSHSVLPGWLHPHLDGELVRVRPPVAGDEPALVQSMTDERVRQFIGGPVDAATAAQKASHKVVDRAWGQFVIIDRVSGEVAGSGSLERKRGPWEISYLLLPAFWRCGFATETVGLMRTWFFRNTAEDLLIATTQPQRTLSAGAGTGRGSFDRNVRAVRLRAVEV
jgi:ribosomal-protein-alanine N-acetyltransferase